MSILCYVDVGFLLTLLVCAIDVVRQTSPLKHPWHSIGFASMSIGAAGWILQDLTGIVPSWYAMALHGGLAIYAALGAWALFTHKRNQSNARGITEPDGGDCWSAVEVVGAATGGQDRTGKHR
jgi:hypothetical protein